MSYVASRLHTDGLAALALQLGDKGGGGHLAPRILDQLGQLLELGRPPVLGQTGDDTARPHRVAVVGRGEEPVWARREELRSLLAAQEQEGVLVVGRQEIADASADGWAEAGEAGLLLRAD